MDLKKSRVPYILPLIIQLWVGFSMGWPHQPPLGPNRVKKYILTHKHTLTGGLLYLGVKASRSLFLGVKALIGLYSGVEASTGLVASSVKSYLLWRQCVNRPIFWSQGVNGDPYNRTFTLTCRGVYSVNLPSCKILSCVIFPNRSKTQREKIDRQKSQ